MGSTMLTVEAHKAYASLVVSITSDDPSLTFADVASRARALVRALDESPAQLQPPLWSVDLRKHLSPRVCNALQRMGVREITDLANVTRDQVDAQHGIGWRSLMAIEEVMGLNGIKFRPPTTCDNCGATH